jgi:putative transposase
MSRSFLNLNYHLVFSTKQREPWLQPDLASRLYPYIGGIIRKEDGCAMAIGGMPDHLHILLSLGVTVAIADTIRNIKAISSGWIHREYPALSEFAWQRDYGLFSVSESRVEIVKDYIHRQMEHHRTKSFQEEFVEFLQKHRIAYELQYLWD